MGAIERPDYPVVEVALDTLARRNVVLCYTSQNLAEFWNACTRPAIRNGYGLSPEEADRRAQFFEAQLRLLPDGRLLVAHRVSGVQVHDAKLVAAMRVHGVQSILTFNQRDFARYSDIQTLDPRTLPYKPNN